MAYDNSVPAKLAPAVRLKLTLRPNSLPFGADPSYLLPDSIGLVAFSALVLIMGRTKGAERGRGPGYVIPAVAKPAAAPIVRGLEPPLLAGAAAGLSANPLPAPFAVAGPGFASSSQGSGTCIRGAIFPATEALCPLKVEFRVGRCPTPLPPVVPSPPETLAIFPLLPGASLAPDPLFMEPSSGDSSGLLVEGFLFAVSAVTDVAVFAVVSLSIVGGTSFPEVISVFPGNATPVAGDPGSDRRLPPAPADRFPSVRTRNADGEQGDTTELVLP